MDPHEMAPPTILHRAQSVTDDQRCASALSTNLLFVSVLHSISVIATNDDATYAKLACVRANYYRDDFVALFASHSAATELMHREPEIKQGYWARVKCVQRIMEQFCEVCCGSWYDMLSNVS